MRDHTDREEHRLSAVRLHRLILPLIVAATLAVLLVIPRDADAGSYRAVQCHRELGAHHADASWNTNSGRYARSSDCSAAGLTVTHEPRGAVTGNGRFGAWTLTAPAGTQIARIGAGVAARAQAGHVPQMLVTLVSGATRAVAGVPGTSHRVGWVGSGGRSLIARLICNRQRGCGAGREARLAVRRISLTLRDLAEPVIGLAGGLLAQGSHRGTQALEVNASDAGSGVRSITAEVNGDPVTANAQACALADGVAVRLRPCPAAVSARIELDTTATAFRQGPNVVRVCAADYATTQAPGLDCESRSVRVDNLCPVSKIQGAVLEARFAGGSTRSESASNRTTLLSGRILDAAGRPLPGARVCIASRVRADGAPERIVATPTTGGGGRFSLTLSAGPSREVRVAHWAGPEHVREQFLDLRSRAVPKLEVKPRRLRNGSRARFNVRLPGPAAAGRRVVVQARSAGRWISVDEGATGRAGTWRGSYRFRSTTGTQRYSFRAVVPRQSGYSYLKGRSRTRSVTVSG